MAPKKHDTDTLERLTAVDATRLDQAPDDETVLADFGGSEDATHRLDPRVWSPLKVCPQCSLAWESDGEWCPSCGTAFDRSKERVQATRVMPAERQAARARRAAEPPLSRSGRRNPSAAQRAPRASGPPKRQATPPPSTSVGASIAKAFMIFALFAVAVTGAFYVGQQSRPSQAEVDQSVSEATDTARQSAVESLKRLQAEFEEKRAAAVAKAREEGRNAAQAEAQATEEASGSLIDKIGQCIVNLNC